MVCNKNPRNPRGRSARGPARRSSQISLHIHDDLRTAVGLWPNLGEFGFSADFFDPFPGRNSLRCIETLLADYVVATA
jgi:hypothetical protein